MSEEENEKLFQEAMNHVFKNQATYTPRDPDRIERILDKLRRYWNRPNYSDLRLIQLFDNLTHELRKTSDLYFVEDDIFEAGLDKALSEFNE